MLKEAKAQNISLIVILFNFLLANVAQSLEISEVEKLAQKITVRIEGSSRGSGVIVERRGNTYAVLTNAHVIQKGRYTAIAPDEKCYRIQSDTIKKFAQIDLAILLFSSSLEYPIARRENSQRLTNDDTVYVGGWARSLGRLYSRVFLLTQGKLLQVNSKLPLGYSLTYSNLVRVGMSGGPILNQQGNLIGINGLVRLTNNSNEIVASGIPINQIWGEYSQLIKQIPVPTSSLISCYSIPTR